jgi:hypothetical protein
VLWGRIPRGNGGRVAAVLVVDNAAQPMQAAPVAALKGIAVSGNASKLHVIFTHFDQVKGNNLPGFSDRDHHHVDNHHGPDDHHPAALLPVATEGETPPTLR